MTTSKKTRTTGVPKFLRHLYSILTTEDPSIISWSADGAAIQLYSVTRLENEVLPKYFKHNKLASFQRQLNYFGFRKWHVCTFSHPEFNRSSTLETTPIARKREGSPASSRSSSPSMSPLMIVESLSVMELPSLDLLEDLFGSDATKLEDEDMSVDAADWAVCADLLDGSDSDMTWLSTLAPLDFSLVV
ncbi:hypothetical protein SPRG_21322 [Saprolegnia parasitica CBS 223.65]|uniref:HSF-type DNA-binding domain-containing protein n=1 Tax=Saprolegnia parasitica (strain CBS 223.65) TaxID=695850 RepID=A0A067BQP5_SAPPC|nr:hypothetical protein SPRG_21322 [Saprolegnia parasitica CBS 223.65]KDO20814.1 hypothetical protein SPRG_21322 [Saprolegnia parasitica CBS 223.65]|eukprot:XP_012208495.1 hypothetical protein SPRG_21322 [Saprolegnia parasitica CBS 223.65]